MKAKKIKHFLSVLIAVIFCLPLVSSSEIKSFASTSNYVTNNEVYYIRNVYSGKYLEVGGNTSNSVLRQSKFTGASNQRFRISYVSGQTTYYNIIPMNNTNLRVDIDNASTTNGTVVKTFDPNPSYRAQDFKFNLNPDNTYHIASRMNERKIIEIAGPSTADGATAQVWDWVGAENQMWILELVNDSYRNMCWDWVFRGNSAHKRISEEHSSYYALDTDPAKGTSIYVPAPGTVIAKGVDSTMGNYVIITFDRPYNGNKLTGRFMHMDSATGFSVGEHVTAARSSIMGRVGNTGTVFPSPTPDNPNAGTHLHMDINVGGYTSGGNLNFNNTILPSRFFPEVSFTYY